MTTPGPAAAHGARAAAAWRAACLDWLRSDAPAWIHVAKTVAAALLAMGIAMRVELPQPRTAMATVFIVMQPQSGLVLAKSFYRFVGTLVGSVVTIAITAAFGQQPELFLLSVALWIGVCTFGAARNRNFRSYAFVLSGYTAALIGLPASSHPEAVFLTAMTRVSEVWLGIACAGAISALVLPQRTADALRDGVRERYRKFSRFVVGALAGSIDRAGIESANVRIIADVIGLEAMRSAAVFEDWGVRLRAGRITRLNNEFMQVSTRFHALCQLLNRTRLHGDSTVCTALEALFRELAPLLTRADGEPVHTAADAGQATAKLAVLKHELPARLRALRAMPGGRTERGLLDFDTAGELFLRFVDEMHAYTQTYASLAVDRHALEQPEPGYVSHTNLTAAGVAGLRAAIAMLLMSAFWIATAWPSGGIAVLNTAVNCALVASMPQPAKAASQMTLGTLLAAIVGLPLMFGVYPHIDGYPLLCAILAPVLMLATLITLRRSWGGVGLGFCISLCILAGPDNVVHFDATQFIGDALALVVSMVLVTLASAVILPPELPWLRKRLLRELQQLVVVACTGRGARVRLRLESAARDLVNQANGVAAQRPDLQAAMLAWMFVVLEVGHAVLELRSELAVLQNGAWRAATQRMLEKITLLFDNPAPRRLEDAKQANAAAIETLCAALRSDAATQQTKQETPEGQATRHSMQRMLSYLHFIRSTLLDPQSPLNGDAGPRA
ncbi:FUSC family protein [Paraburkholderia jirisanensis]